MNKIKLSEIDKVVNSQVSELEQRLVDGIMNGHWKNGHPFDNGLTQDALLDLKREFYNVALTAIKQNGFEVPELQGILLWMDQLDYCVTRGDE